jgi:hypothetical protein
LGNQETRDAKLLPPTINCVIERVKSRERERQEDELLPGSKNPDFSVFPASLNPDKLIGSKNPGHGGGLVGRHILLHLRRRCKDVQSFGGD